MPKFRFIVQAPSGKLRRGTISEKDEAAARIALNKAGFHVNSLVEEPDVVVHTTTAPAGRAKLKPERASIIEFEESALERAGDILNRYFLRRETALLLGVAGLVWVVLSWFGGGEEPPPPELEYTLYTISVSVDTSGYDADRVEVRLPEVPFKVEERVEPDSSGAQSVTLEVELAVEPVQVEVALKDATVVLARAEGTLVKDGEGRLSFSPEWVAEPSTR